MTVYNATDSQLRNWISDHIKLLEIDAHALAASKERMGKFLIAGSVLSTILREVDIDLAKAEALKDSVEAKVIDELPGQKITEKKTMAKADPEFQKATLEFKNLTSKRSWLSVHIKLFENAHIMFRQLSAGVR